MKQQKFEEEAIKILKNLEYDKNLIPKRFEKWWLTYLHTHSYHYLNLLSFLSKEDMKRKVLEIGSAPGHFPVLLKILGFDVEGIDIDPLRFKELWDKYKVQVNKVDIERENLPFSENYFDIVLFTEILEHLRWNPLHAIREVYRIMKYNGRIILSTPKHNPMASMAISLGEGLSR